MKLHIENYILEKSYNTSIQQLFAESVTCYRNGAYRASLLFSYLGFLTIIKHTIIRSKLPPDFSQPEWDNLIAKVNNDRIWEEEVIEALVRVNKPIFKISDDLRQQIQYWKARRNDCAHFKDNEITAQHTEMFWSFVKSSIPKLTVEGGMQSLLNKFEDHFDDNKTPRGADFTALVMEIENSIVIAELPEFFDLLDKHINRHAWWYSENETHKVYLKILDACSAKIHEPLVQYLREKDRDLLFLNLYPEKTARLNFNATELRTLWKTRIYTTRFNINPFNIVSGLLRENLIPSGQHEEVARELLNRYQQQSYHKLPRKDDVHVFRSNRLYDIILKVALIEQDLDPYLWVNSKCDLLVHCIENTTLTNETVSKVFEMPQRTNYSRWLVVALQRAFDDKPELKLDFHNIANLNGIAIPSEFN